MLQGCLEFVPAGFCNLLSHGPPPILLLPVLVFALNPRHPGLLIIKLFSHWAGHLEVWDSFIGSVGGAVVDFFTWTV